MTDRSAVALEAQESFEVHKEKNIDLLHSKAVGLMGVLFLTVTGRGADVGDARQRSLRRRASATGIYVPAAFLLATIVLTIFSVGLRRHGAEGVDASAASTPTSASGSDATWAWQRAWPRSSSYSVFEASLCGLFAYFANALDPDPSRHQRLVDLVGSIHDRADLGS